MNNNFNPFSLLGPSGSPYSTNFNRTLHDPLQGLRNPTLHDPLQGLNNFTHVTAPAPTSSMPLCEPSKYVGKLLSDPWGGQVGEFVSFVKVCTGDHRPTSNWGMGENVKGNSNLVPGTPIATFGPDGKYAGGHAAIYMGQDQNGIQVMDQWAERSGRQAHPVAPRTIRWDGVKPSNNGSLFHVIK